MERRRFFLTSLAAVVAAPRAVEAQQATLRPRVAVLYPGSPVQQNALVEAFVHGMRDHGYVDGKDFALDVHYIGTHVDELQRATAAVVGSRPEVIVTVGSPGAWAAKRATATNPIVMTVAADPVGQGLVASLAKPGGNITGNAILTEAAILKRLEFVHEAFPKARRIGILQNPSNRMYAILWERLRAAAKPLGVTLLPFDTISAAALDSALHEIARQRPDAVIVGQDNIFYLTRSTIVGAMSRADELRQ